MTKRKNAERELSVWIELPKPVDKVHGEQLAELANNMLKRLAKPDDTDTDRGFFWSEHERRFCYGGAMGYQVLSDFGQRFNLDYLGRPLEEAAAPDLLAELEYAVRMLEDMGVEDSLVPLRAAIARAKGA